MRSRRKWTKALAATALVLLAVCAVCLSGCGPPTRVIPKIAVHLEKGQMFVAPEPGWFLSDSELKQLLMSEYDTLIKEEP